MMQIRVMSTITTVDVEFESYMSPADGPNEHAADKKVNFFLPRSFDALLL